MANDDKIKNNNQSLEKALRIIEYMAENRQPVRLQDIAQQLGYPASTVIRFLATLEKNNYVKQNPETLRYSLTLKLSKIGTMVYEQYNMRDLVKPYLVELVHKVGESACLAIEENNRAVYIDVQSGPSNILQVMQRIGKEAPLHCTGVGKLLLLNHDRETLRTRVEKEGLQRLTHHTITSYESLQSELEQVSGKGYALDDEECEIGARCVAAPIRDYTSHIVASISVSGPVSRMNMQKIEFIRQHVIETANEISKVLGYEG